MECKITQITVYKGVARLKYSAVSAEMSYYKHSVTHNLSLTKLIINYEVNPF